MLFSCEGRLASGISYLNAKNNKRRTSNIIRQRMSVRLNTQFFWYNKQTYTHRPFFTFPSTPLLEWHDGHGGRGRMTCQADPWWTGQSVVTGQSIRSVGNSVFNRTHPSEQLLVTATHGHGHSHSGTMTSRSNNLVINYYLKFDVRHAVV